MNVSTQQVLDERNRFLVELDDATRSLENPEQITETAARLLGQHLKVNRCAYADVEQDEDTFNLTGNYNDGVDSIVGRYTFTQFGTECLRLMRAGLPYVVVDSENDQRINAVRESYRFTRIRAVICVPLLKAERFVAAMAVHQAEVREWRPDEVELLQLVASRCWESIERTRITRELRDSEMRLRMAQQAGRTGTFDWNMETGHVYWSPALEHMYGLPEGAFEGKLENWSRRVVKEDVEGVIAGMQSAMARKDAIYNYEFRALLSDGSHHWMRGQAQFEYAPDGRPLRMLGVNIDINEQKLAVARELAERKRAEIEKESLLQAERVARSAAERAGSLKDEFLATLSHELRTPLNAILGWTHILKSKPGDAAIQREGLEVIDRNARAQAQIVNDLLDMNRIISGKIRLEVQRVDLVTVVQGAIDSLRPTADAKGVRLQVVLDPNAGPISGDSSRLQQIFWNLISNAIKFTPREGRVQVVLERVNSHLEVSVIDTGDGIKPEFLPFVFDRFRQADASTTRTHGGLGLGLAIAKQLVELHGGTIRVKSAGEKTGSTFCVALPLAPIQSMPQELTGSDRQHPGGGSGLIVLDDNITLSGRHVLVVDDEADARNLVCRLLEDVGATVSTASSAAEAMHYLASSSFDVLVSDIGMPGEDGYSLLRRVRSLSPEQGGNVPALALTAYARTEDRVRAILAGFQMHIAKPVEAAELITMVASLAGVTQRSD